MRFIFSTPQLFDISFSDSLLPYSAVIVGTGLSLATAGQVSTFAVLLMDQFSEGKPQRADCNRVVAVSANFGNGNKLFASSSAQVCQNGTYNLSYNVTQAGKFLLSLLQKQGFSLPYVTFQSNTFSLIIR